MSNGAQDRGDSAAERPQTGQQPTSGSHSQQAAESPEELQRDIEHTREELGDTVDALSQKADVKAQAQEAIDEQKQKLRAKRDELKQKVSGAGGSSAGAGDAGQRARALVSQLAERTSDEPLPYLGGALAAGLVVGLVLRGRNQ